MNEPRQRELIAGARVPGILLSGRDEAACLDRLAAILDAARLNLHFPDVRRLRSHLASMHPRVHGGRYPGVELDLRSGLPTYKEWTRVATDTRIADRVLPGLADGALSGRPELRAEQLRKREYYSTVRATELAPLGAMAVQLRRVDPKTRTAWFHVVLDKLDASGTFVRHSIDLAQHASVWSKPAVVLDEETAQHTEEFQSLIYTLASFDAEVTLLKLAALGGLGVERVVKGTVGPIFSSFNPPPRAVAEVLPSLAAGFLGTFAVSMAAIDVAEDADEDPLGPILLPGPWTAARELDAAARAARQRLGFRTHRTRKFVAPPAVAAELESYLAARGKKALIYVLDGAP